ncbi:MAG: carbohydrate-binding protein CenC [Kosmotoga sp.]|nr:MAG: carbohydrate-binding protein CenC [Kosmotoga sp.]
MDNWWIVILGVILGAVLLVLFIPGLIFVEEVAVIAEDLHEGSVINNGDFNAEIVNDQEGNPYEWWIWEAGNYGISGAKLSNYGVEEGYAFLEIENAGPEPWHLQFNQRVGLKNEQSYLISFKARANAAKTINVKILQTHEPWTNYFAESVQLTEDWKTFEFYYIHPRTADATVTFGYELGKDPATTVYFDDVVVKPVDKSQVPQKEEVKTEEETVDYFFDEEEPEDLISNGDFSVGIMNDQASMPYEWWIWQASDYGMGGAKVSEYGVNEGYAFLVLEDTGTEPWHIQFNQWINIKQGNKYKISLKVKADKTRPINVKLVQTGAPYGVYFEKTLDLTQEWQTFEFDYVHPEDGDPIVTFSSELGKQATTTVYFDDVSVKPVASE